MRSISYALMKELITADSLRKCSEDMLKFRHALTRQASYTDLLVRDRRSLHYSVASTIVRIFANVLDRHLVTSPIISTWQENGRKYWSMRNAKVKRHRLLPYAPRAAIENYTHALEAAQRLSQTPKSELHRARGQCYEILADLLPYSLFICWH